MKLEEILKVKFNHFARRMKSAAFAGVLMHAKRARRPAGRARSARDQKGYSVCQKADGLQNFATTR